MAIMTAPANGVKVRMYRQGHGDCFLLAMPKANGSTFYLLIDCGLKPGSEIENGPDIVEVIDHIRDATAGFVDVVAITHEHEDHVSGFYKSKPSDDDSYCWDDIEVGETWLAWTEDGDDDFANELRDEFNDTLIALAMAAGRMRASSSSGERLAAVEALLGFEMGGAGELTALQDRLAALDRSVESEIRRGNRSGALALRRKGLEEAFAVSKKTIKEGVKRIRDKTPGNIRFFRPDQPPTTLSNLPGVRFYAFGPPRDKALLKSLNPRTGEKFHLAKSSDESGFLAAVAPGAATDARLPFRAGIGHKVRERRDKPPKLYGRKTHLHEHFDATYSAPGADWRRIDSDWLNSAEALALRINSEVNNTSLVLAIELIGTGRVLLFTGDAQRGNWFSWSRLTWPVPGSGSVSAKELMARTVLYKVGHHGSHNATLAGAPDDEHANLAWMAAPPFAEDYVAMIPSNEVWARDQKPHPWRHPLKEIAEALHEKARGRVLQTNIGMPVKPGNVTDAEWQRFTDRLNVTDQFIEIEFADA